MGFFWQCKPCVIVTCLLYLFNKALIKNKLVIQLKKDNMNMNIVLPTILFYATMIKASVLFFMA